MIAPVETSVLAIDPGSVYSAWVLLQGETPIAHGKDENPVLLHALRTGDYPLWTVMAIETMRARGMPTSNDELVCCMWTGRFMEAWAGRGGHFEHVYRADVKLHICGQARAKDSNIRAALIDRYGGKDAAIGRKKSPGPLHGFASDRWAALAVGLTYLDSAKSALSADQGRTIT